MMHRPPSDLDAITNSGETEVELVLVDGTATLTDSRTEAVKVIAEAEHSIADRLV